MKKNQKFVDQERDDGCKKRIRGVVGQIQIEPAPAIGLSDILNIGELGRWWRVGAAVVVKRDDKNEKKEQSMTQEAIPASLKEAAKKLRMNTDNKVIIIVVFQKLTKYLAEYILFDEYRRGFHGRLE